MAFSVNEFVENVSEYFGEGLDDNERNGEIWSKLAERA